MYFLQERGINIEKGILDYPKLRKREEVRLEVCDKDRIKTILTEIEKIASQEKMPKVINQKLCKSCAYYEYCYI
jgi:CRISPR-associated exonuclease Cas4